MLYSEFDTNLLSLTVIPVLGFWKLYDVARHTRSTLPWASCEFTCVVS